MYLVDVRAGVFWECESNVSQIVMTVSVQTKTVLASIVRAEKVCLFFRRKNYFFVVLCQYLYLRLSIVFSFYLRWRSCFLQNVGLLNRNYRGYVFALISGLCIFNWCLFTLVFKGVFVYEFHFHFRLISFISVAPSWTKPINPQMKISLQDTGTFSKHITD